MPDDALAKLNDVLDKLNDVLNNQAVEVAVLKNELKNGEKRFDEIAVQAERSHNSIHKISTSIELLTEGLASHVGSHKYWTRAIARYVPYIVIAGSAAYSYIVYGRP